MKYQTTSDALKTAITIATEKVELAEVDVGRAHGHARCSTISARKIVM